MVRGRASEKVFEDVLDWVEVKRRIKRRTAQGRREEEGKKNRKTVQMLVNVEGSKAFPLEVSLTVMVSDVVRRTPSSARCSKRDVYLTSWRRVLRRSEDLRSCGVSDGSAVQVTSRMRSGGTHKDNKSKADKKRVASLEKQPQSDKGPAIQERDKRKVLRSCAAV